MAHQAPVVGDRQGGRRRRFHRGTGGQPGREARRVTPRLVPVAAGEEDHHGQTRPLRADDLHDPPIPVQHGGGADLPVAQTIVVGRIGAGQIEHEPRLDIGHHARQDLLDRPQVELVADAGPQLHAGRLDGLDVVEVTVVDRQRVHRRIVGEDPARALTVVQVEVDDEDRAAEAAIAQVRDGHRDVVEQAEALATVGHGVVQAAAEVEEDAPVPQRETCSEDRASHHGALGEQEVVDSRGVDGVSDHSRQTVGRLEGAQIVGIVHVQELAQRYAARPVQVTLSEDSLLVELREHPLPAPAVDHRRVEVHGVPAAVHPLDGRTVASRNEAEEPPTPPPSSLSPSGRVHPMSSVDPGRSGRSRRAGASHRDPGSSYRSRSRRAVRRCSRARTAARIASMLPTTVTDRRARVTPVYSRDRVSSG